MEKQSSTKIIALCAIAVAVNVVIGRTVSLFNIPFLFLDTMGTIFIAANFGMSWGVLTGLTTNLLAAVLGGGAVEIPFGLINVAVAIIVALIARNNFSYKKAALAGVLLGVICPIIGTLIRLTLFGGFTGSGADIFISILRASGQNIFASTFLATLGSNLIDKITSSLLVSMFSQVPAIEKIVQRVH